MQLSVVILAAGQGKRMNSDLPKVLQPLAGKPLVKHVIDAARALQPADIYVVYGHGGAQVQAALRDEPVDWILQAEQLGTGHAVMQAMSVIPDEHTVLVLYGDVPLVRQTSLEALLTPSSAGALSILSVVLDQPVGYGRIVRDKAGAVTAIVEHKDATAAQLSIDEVNTGLLAAPAKLLRELLLGLNADNAQREYYLTDTVAGAVAQGNRVEAIPAVNPAEVQGVNDKIQLAQVEAALRQIRAEALMLAGVSLADPARTDIRGVVHAGRDVFIDVNVVFMGEVHLGARVQIGPNCVIDNARIGADTEIKANSVIEDTIIGENCRIGPFARLRPGANLASDVHIGNFVEVKNSTLGIGTKANHLTYLGDARVGSGVNIGAGSITCNYDGANKWPTQIGDGAFLGSGSLLVAPVTVGNGATVGAGSVITSAVPAGELTLTRARQTTVMGWTRPRKLSDDEKNARVDDALQEPKL